MINTQAANAAVNSAVNAVAGAASSHPLAAAAVGVVTTGLAAAKIVSLAVPECRKFPRQMRNLRGIVRRKVHAWSAAKAEPLNEGEVFAEVRKTRHAATAAAAA